MDPELRSLMVDASVSRIQQQGALRRRARRDVAVNASLLGVCVVGLAAHAADARAVASGCFALLGAFMAYAVYIALCAMKAYTVSVGNLPEPEHDSDDSAYGHSHFHGHESSDSDKED